MLEAMEKAADIIEALLLEIADERDPKVNDRLASLGDKLAAIVLDLKDRTTH